MATRRLGGDFARCGRRSARPRVANTLLLEGMVEVDRKGDAAAAPHAFLLSSRMFVEGLADARGFSPPEKAFVRVPFNVRLLFTISSWGREETGKKEAEAGPWLGRRLCVNRGTGHGEFGAWSLYNHGELVSLADLLALDLFFSK